MKTLKYSKLILPAIAIVLITGCSGPQPKSQSLLEAEEAYTQAKSDPTVLEYAAPQLESANATLQAAALAETEESMTSLTYIANAQIQTAVQTSETGKAIQKFKDLSSEKEALMTQSLQQQKATLENKLTKLEAKETDRGLMYSLGDVLFVYGKADLQPGAAEPIKRVANFMKQHPEKTMLIEGHTDSTGSAAFNQKLSLQRAEYVMEALKQRGVAASRMKAIGLGQSQPIATNTTDAGRQKNRRVEIIIQD
jgi:outer membrane protein OmpA-like peptidoglycan-associated protein